MEATDREIEEAVLGCVLLTSSYMPRLLDVGLRPHHFYFDEHKRCFEAMVALFDNDATIDRITVQRKSGVAQSLIDILALGTPSPGGAKSYALELIALFERRRLIEAGRLLLDSGINDDKALRERAELLLSTESEGLSRTFSPEQLASKFWDRLERGASKATPFPWGRMNELVGGMRPGEVTLIGGWTSHGKSVLLDDILCKAAEHCSTHLFINEMTSDERVDRYVSKKTAIPSLFVSDKTKLTSNQVTAVVDAIGTMPYGITEASGWSAQDLRREIRRRSYGVVGIDILHLIEYREERDLAAISRTLNIAAKESNCHILATVHLKDERLKSAVPPAPTLSDIKGAGALKQDADNVMFVYRECDEVGAPQIDSKIWFAKSRQGQTGGIRVEFDGRRMSFVEQGWGG
jgi:replicative DNA helicase